MQIESKRNIAKYIFAFGGVQGMNIAIGLVRNKLVALLLGPNGMGIMALYGSSVQMLQSACNLGLDKSAIPDISRTYDGGDIGSVRRSICQIRSLFVIAAVTAVIVSVSASWLLSLMAFSDFTRTLHFMALSPVAALLILCSGEVAILKATRQLKRLASLSVCNVVAALVVSVPLFYVWGSRAIIPSLVLTAVAQLLITIAFSYHHYPLQLSFSRELMANSMPVIRLGVAFVVASTMTSGAEFLIRGFLNTQGDDTMVGLYNAAYMIAFTYGGVVFSAIDSEYFPRLSQIKDVVEMKATILRQIKVCLLVVVPLVTALIFLLPWIVPLLFSKAFAEAVPMAQVTLIAIIFRAVYLPIGYVPLSRGDSKCFLFLEGMSAVSLAACVLLAFHFYGLVGCGYGIVVANILDMVMNIITVRRRYGFSLL